MKLDESDLCLSCFWFDFCRIDSRCLAAVEGECHSFRRGGDV
jgi:hypothetical protein